MSKSKRGRNLKGWRTNRSDAGMGKLRIIGGKWRGRLVDYSGDPVTRPMKDNIREAVFNLVGGWVKGKTVFDLFAGTGAIGLEAMSRGAAFAYFVERHFPTVKIIQQNIDSLESSLKEVTDVNASDTFFWVRKFTKQSSFPENPWLVFCCPPYDFYVQRKEDIHTMLTSLMPLAPAQSIFVVESDDRFDPANLPQPTNNPHAADSDWVVREYSPAKVAVLKFGSQAQLDH